MSDFVRGVAYERARLALLDPEGEAEAVAPLDGVRARQTLLAQRDRDRIPRGNAGRLSGRDLLERLGADPTRSRGVTRCPAHDDRAASLSWRRAENGMALLHCFAGCTFDEIRASLG